jgi:DNA adenine methylase
MPITTSDRRALKAAAPILKWAGGKRQLLPALRAHYPSSFGAYYEPFVGSAAVFFDLAARGCLADRDVVLADVNGDLVGFYRTVRTRVGETIAVLRGLAQGHAIDPAAHYYRVRDHFNRARRGLRERHDRWWDHYDPELAAMLLYLNRTGYNGLFRLNGGGDFNVPVGRYARPTICDEPRLMTAARCLGERRLRLVCEPFADVLAGARRGDFVYLDPPYAPVSATATFTRYTAGGFSSADQRALQAVVVILAERGCHVLLSNSTAAEIAALYDSNDEVRRAGLQAIRVPARRAINSNADRRGDVLEYLVTNVPGA